MNIYFDDLKRHISELKSTCDSKNHKRANETFAEEVQLFLNHWKLDWYLVYLHMHSPLSPFVFAFLAKPSKEIDELNEYFNNWSMSPENYYYGNLLEPLLDFRYQKVLSAYEPLIFLRSHPEKLIIEISQKFIQCNNLFLNENGNSYNRQNANGEFEDLLFISNEEKFTAILMHKKILEPYMLGTKKCLIRMFDVMAGTMAHCGEDHRFNFHFEPINNFFIANTTRLIFKDNHAMQYCRGGEIIKPIMSKKEAKRFAFNQSEEKDLKFWARNRLTNKFEIKSCKTNDQHYLDPVFFNPEVLSKYTSYPSKYTLEEGKLSCKLGGWILRSCYKSSDNQIYCYLGDLSLLPPSEQMHWKSYNLQVATGQENMLAMRRDFHAEWIEEENGKNDLKRILANFPAVNISENLITIWSPKEDLNTMINALHTPTIEEYEQYRNFIGALARLTTEGFQKSALQKWADHLGVKIEDINIGSIVLLEKCIGTFKSKDIAEDIIKPLKNLNKKKSSISSHGGGDRLPKKAIISDSNILLVEVTKSMQKIFTLLKN